MNSQPELTISAAVAAAAQELTIAGCATPRLDAELLLAHVLQQERTWLYLNPDAVCPPPQLSAFHSLLARRKEREPVAYLLGHKEFFAMEFLVNPHVLIPRPETELLVETALQLSAETVPRTIADIGTGSGCIAIALARHLPRSRLFAIDISAPALDVARQNAARHQLSEQIIFLHGSLLAPLPQTVEMIVSNPPYVSPAELASPETMLEVRQHEPRQALDGGGQHGLDIIGQLLGEAPAKLTPGGSMLIEIGFSQGPAVSRLARAHFPNASITIEKDLAGLDRLLVIQTPPA